MTEPDAARTPEELFEGHPATLEVFRAVETAVRSLGMVQVRVGRSQVAFTRSRGFAYVWRPGQYVANDVAAVLSLALRRRLTSTRFKEVVHPASTVWMHHLELASPSEVDAEVRGWLSAAYDDAR